MLFWKSKHLTSPPNLGNPELVKQFRSTLNWTILETIMLTVNLIVTLTRITISDCAPYMWILNAGVSIMIFTKIAELIIIHRSGYETAAGPCHFIVTSILELYRFYLDSTVWL